MKLSFTTLSCPDWSWDEIVSRATRMGYDGIELGGVEGELFIPRARPFLPENIEATIEQLRVGNLDIPLLNPMCRFHDADAYGKYLEEGIATIDLAARLKSPYIRVFGNNIPDPDRRQETFDRVANGIRELCRYGAKKNVGVLFETHGDFPGMDTIGPLIDSVGSPGFGILWDMMVTYGKYGADTAGFLDTAFKYIRHVHVKDAYRPDGGKFIYCRLGRGEVPIVKNLQLLKQAGYSGYLSMEWEKKWVPTLEEPEIVLPEYIEYIRKNA